MSAEIRPAAPAPHVTGAPVDALGDLRRRREILTPEGVPLVFHVATAGDRLGAVVLDVVFLVGALLVLGLGSALSLGGFGFGWLWAYLLVVAFLVRNFYFVWFELRWQGRTPGKRITGLRLIDAPGGMLGSDAVLARNLTREVELWIPLMIAFNPGLLGESVPGWLGLAAALWVFLFALLPLFNRDRRRVGDLVAGTLVVQAPRAVLLRDLGSASADSQVTPRFAFTVKQLEMYGVYELQVLEDLLRRPGTPAETLRVVAEKVQRKIAWEGETDGDPRDFLRAFYRSQRARLEQQKLLGKARERKRKGRLEREA